MGGGNTGKGKTKAPTQQLSALPQLQTSRCFFPDGAHKCRRQWQVPFLWGVLGDSRTGEMWRSERGKEKLVIQQEQDTGARGYRSARNLTPLLQPFTKLFIYE